MMRPTFSTKIFGDTFWLTVHVNLSVYRIFRKSQDFLHETVPFNLNPTKTKNVQR